MTDRLIAVGDAFTLPAAAKVADVNLPAVSTLYAAKSVETSKLDVTAAATTYATLDANGKQPVRKGELVVNAWDYLTVGATPAQNAAALQAVLDIAQVRPLRVTFPGGQTIDVGQKLYVRSNTDIDLCGSTLRRAFNTGPGGVSLLQWSDNVENLTFRNGTLHGNGANYPGNAGTEGFNIIGGTGIKNGLFENVIFKDVVGDHSIDANTIDGLTVRNCRFLGFKDIVGDRNYSESIQLDPNILSNAGTNNKNVLVTGCYFGPSDTPGFGSPGTGIGNHASVNGRTDTNIRITDNVFDGCGFAGIRPFRWDNVIIKGNSFLNLAGRGIHITPLSSATITPESGTGYTITGNTFTNVVNPILFATPTLGPGNAYSLFHSVTITGNTVTGGSDSFTLCFIKQCTVTGNTFANVATPIKAGYNDGLTITGNSFDTSTGNFIWIAETTFTATLAAQGLTRRTTITGNEGTNAAFRGVHINAAARTTTITGNTFENVSTAAATRDGITVDSSANGGLIEGNTILDGGATNKPLKGVNVTSSAVSWRIGPNNAFGTTKGVSNDAPTTTLTGVLVTGTPEGAIVGAVGSMVTRTDGGALTTFYVKESGTGNTGWVAK